MDPDIYSEVVPEGKSILVVSDLHLGGYEGQETAERFCNFLKTLKTGSVSVTCQSDIPKETLIRNLLPPAKIILLGDILDLWNPRDQDRTYAFIDSLTVFLRLQEFSCDVIYVTGNHDEDMGEPVTSYGQNPPNPDNPAYSIYQLCKKKSGKIEALKIAWNDANILELSPRHYPATSKHGHVTGLNAGGIHYVFIHGQQFDAQQVTYTIGQAIGSRFDIIDSIEEILNCSIIREVRKSAWALSSITVFSLLVLGNMVSFFLHAGSWYALTTALTGFVVSFGFLILFGKGIQLFGIQNRDLPSSPLLFRLSAGFAGGEMILLLAGAYLNPVWLISLFHYAGLFIFFGLLFLFTIPILYGALSNWMYNTLFSAKNYNVKAVYENALKSEKYTYNAEVLIFGHTHIPGTYPETEDDIRQMGASWHGKPPLLINTGAWVRNIYGIDDSFAYIDSAGVGLMKWNDGPKKITCTKYFPKEIIKKRSAMQSKL